MTPEQQVEAIQILKAIIDSEGYSYFADEWHCRFCDEWWGSAGFGGWKLECHDDDCPIGQAIAFLKSVEQTDEAQS